MWFKALQFYILDEQSNYNFQQLEKQVSGFAFQPSSTATPKTWGWYPPTDKKSHPLIHAANGFMMICLKTEEKVVPQSIIKEFLADKVEELELEGLRVSKKEKQRLKEEIIQNLLPRAFHKSNKTYAYIDTKHHQLVIDAPSPKKADDFLIAFRKTFDFKLSLPDIQSSCALMTEWLSSNTYPDPFVIEDTCALQSAQEDISHVKYGGQNLLTDNVREHLNDGFFVKQMAMSYADQLSFTLNESCIITKLRFLELVKDLAKDAYRETDAQSFDADFVIMTETLRDFIQSLLQVFGTQEDEPDKTDAIAQNESVVTDEAMA